MIRNRRAGVEDRWRKADGTPSAADGQGKRWRARYVADGREHAKSFDTKARATQWLNTIVSAQETGSYIDPKLGRTTFGSFYREWAPRQVWENNTRYRATFIMASVTFADVALTDLRPSHLEAWVKAMQDQGLAPSTIQSYFSRVRAVIRAAIRDQLVSRDISAGVRLPQQRKASAAMAIPAAREVGAAIAAASPWFAALIAVCAFAGLRRGEAAGLRVSDIDFLRREIRVSRQFQWATGIGAEVRAPKYGSERTVYVADELIDTLAEHVRVHCPGDDPGRWLFPSRRPTKERQPLSRQTIDHAWDLARNAAGIGHRLHDLRHFYASGLIATGCDVVTVQRALGHSSATVTLSTYAHLWPDADDRTRAAARELMKQAFGAAADALRTDGQA